MEEGQPICNHPDLVGRSPAKRDSPAPFQNKIALCKVTLRKSLISDMNT
ncbi:MAG: hypothetical protein IH852_14495 [Bacteroidetes bacterium]|nr:hypothetical protein [Bacteroidota bacterium]